MARIFVTRRISYESDCILFLTFEVKCIWWFKQ